MNKRDFLNKIKFIAWITSSKNLQNSRIASIHQLKRQKFNFTAQFWIKHDTIDLLDVQKKKKLLKNKNTNKPTSKLQHCKQLMSSTSIHFNWVGVFPIGRWEFVYMSVFQLQYDLPGSFWKFPNPKQLIDEFFPVCMINLSEKINFA